MTWEAVRARKAKISRRTSSAMFLPMSASSTIRPVMMLGSSPTAAESRIVTNTSRNWGQ